MAQPKLTVTDWPCHHDPKNLWPTLAGLSLLVHLALFLIGLPLVIRLTQPEGEGTDTVVVPVERVDPSADVAATPTETVSPASPTTTAPPPSPAPTPSPAGTPSSSPSSNPPSAPAPNSPPAPSPNAGPSSTPTPSPNPASPAPSPRPSPTPNPTPSSTPSPTPNPTPSPSPSPAPSPSPSPGSSPSPNPTPSPEPSPTPVPGGSPLPSPDDGSGQGSVFVSVAAPLGRIPEDVPGDRPDQYPELQTPSNDAIVISGINQTCAPSDGLSLSGSASLQVVISQSGTLTRALNATSPFEQFVACLLPKAGFQFNPARVGGTPVATDRVIITVEISPGN